MNIETDNLKKTDEEKRLLAINKNLTDTISLLKADKKVLIEQINFLRQELIDDEEYMDMLSQAQELVLLAKSYLESASAGNVVIADSYRIEFTQKVGLYEINYASLSYL